MRIEFDPNQVTLEECEEFEALTGQSFAALFNTPRSARTVAWIVWRERRKEEPELTYADARRMRFSEIEWELPTEAAAEETAPAAADASEESSPDSPQPLDTPRLHSVS